MTYSITDILDLGASGYSNLFIRSSLPDIRSLSRDDDDGDKE
jgi:hypothetical protein